MKQRPISHHLFTDSSPGTLQSELLNANMMLDLLPTGILVCDATGQIVQSNKKLIEIFGESTAGKTAFDFFNSRTFYTLTGKRYRLEESEFKFPFVNEHEDESLVLFLEDSGARVHAIKVDFLEIKDSSGNRTGVLFCFAILSENILKETEQKLREHMALQDLKLEENIEYLKEKNEALKRSEERYHKMIEEVQDYAIILLDQNGIIQNWNLGAERIKGYKDFEIIGKSFEEFYLPEDRENGLPRQLIEEAKKNGKAIHEGWRMRKDGSRFWGSIVITALHDELNNIIGFSKVTRDLTERKIAEEKLRDYMSELEFQNRELEQFAYAASHDMKEPLRKIHFYNSYIVENAGDILPDKEKEYLNRSIAAVKRMNNLIEDLLTYSKTTANIESFDDVDMHEVIEEIALVHKDEFEKNNVTIEIEELPVVFAVPFQIKQLFDNLVNNSIKYKHPDRDVVIHLSSKLVRGAEIDDKDAEARKYYHHISISDNGIGFEPEYSEKIFEIFQRLNSAPGTKGSGIGLAICKKIVQNHRGFIRASGQVNEGATFDIYLPSRRQTLRSAKTQNPVSQPV